MGPVATVEVATEEMAVEMVAAAMVEGMVEAKLAVVDLREVATVVVAMAEAQKEAWVAMAAMVGQAGRRSGKLRCCRRMARRIGLASGSSFRDKCTKTTAGSNNSSCDGGDAFKQKRYMR